MRDLLFSKPLLMPCLSLTYSPVTRHGLGLTTWSPLASGVLTGKCSGGELPAGSQFTVEQYKVEQGEGVAPFCI